jgi:hypothetical protein
MFHKGIVYNGTLTVALATALGKVMLYHLPEHFSNDSAHFRLNLDRLNQDASRYLTVKCI